MEICVLKLKVVFSMCLSYMKRHKFKFSFFLLDLRLAICKYLNWYKHKESEWWFNDSLRAKFQTSHLLFLDKWVFENSSCSLTKKCSVNKNIAFPTAHTNGIPPLYCDAQLLLHSDRCIGFIYCSLFLDYSHCSMYIPMFCLGFFPPSLAHP